MTPLNFTIFDSQAFTKALYATLLSQTLENPGCQGVKLFLDISAVLGTSPTLDVKFQTYDPEGNDWVDIPGAAFAQKTSTGSSVLTIHPAITASAGVAISQLLSKQWRAHVTIGGTAGALAVGTLTSDATAPSNGDTVTIGDNVYTFVTALTEVKASSALVGDGTNAANGSIITIGDVVYTYKTTLTQVRAAVTLTSDATNPADGGTITLGYGSAKRTYTFKTTLTGAQNEIKIGASAAATLDNVKSAINNSGTIGTHYGPTMAHPQIEATTNTDTTQLLQGRIGGGYEFQLGNTMVATETATHLAFGTALFIGGVDPVAYEVLIGADDDGSLANLDAAIDADGTAGTEYSTGTVAHPLVTSTVSTNTLTVTARSIGVDANTIATLASTSPDSHQDWAAAELGEGTGASTPGVDSIANEVLIGVSAAVALDNIKSAVNATAGAGTTYSTATVIHPLVDATTNANTTQVFSSRAGTLAAVANAITFEESGSHTSVGAAALAGAIDDATFTMSLAGSYC